MAKINKLTGLTAEQAIEFVESGNNKARLAEYEAKKAEIKALSDALEVEYSKDKAIFQQYNGIHKGQEWHAKKQIVDSLTTLGVSQEEILAFVKAKKAKSSK